MVGTSSGQLAYVKETVVGTTPATPAFKVVDFTGEDLALTVTQSRSAAITPNRVVRSSRRTGREVGNGFNLELYKASEVDEMLAALLGQTAFTGSPLEAKAGGVVANTYTFEHRVSPTDFRRFTGCRISMAEFTFAPESIIGVRVGVTGYSMVTAAAIVTGATYAPAATTEKLTSLDIANITLSNGLAVPLDFENLSFSVNNQHQTRKRLGPVSVRGISDGQVLVTGSARCYIDKALADVYIADTSFDMDIVTAFAGDGYTFKLKTVKITSLTEPNSGNNDEYMGAIEFEATLNATYNSSFGITKTS